MRVPETQYLRILVPEGAVVGTSNLACWADGPSGFRRHAQKDAICESLQDGKGARGEGEEGGDVTCALLSSPQNRQQSSQQSSRHMDVMHW